MQDSAQPKPSSERARAIQGMFSAIAPRYDLLNRVLSFGIDDAWRSSLVSHLPRGNARVLDLACGTGDVTIAAAERRPQAKLVGADFSLPMLKGAVPKVKHNGLTARVDLHNASAEDLPYRSRMFDAVTIAFGIRNVVRRDRALGEMRRVLKPGGKALILDFSMPPNAAVRFGYGVYFHRILPVLGGIISGNYKAYRYLPESVEDFPERDEFARMMEEAGFQPVDYQDFTLGVATLYKGVA